MSVVNVKVAYIRPKYNNLEEWCSDKNNVYIGRGGVVFIDGSRYPTKSSIWANPYKVDKDGDRDKVIRKYKKYIKEEIASGNIKVEALLALKHKTLGCWCAPEACHGDVLLKLIKKYSK